MPNFECHFSTDSFGSRTARIRSNASGCHDEKRVGHRLIETGKDFQGSVWPGHLFVFHCTEYLSCVKFNVMGTPSGISVHTLLPRSTRERSITIWPNWLKITVWAFWFSIEATPSMSALIWCPAATVTRCVRLTPPVWLHPVQANKPTVNATDVIVCLLMTLVFRLNRLEYQIRKIKSNTVYFLTLQK